MNESCHTYEWVMKHIWMSHVTHMNESCRNWTSHVMHVNGSCHTYEWVMSHIWMNRVKHTNVSCHTKRRVISECHSTNLTKGSQNTNFLRALWKYIQHSAEHSNPCRLLCTYTYEWFMSHIWMSHVTHMNESCHTYEWVMWHIWMSHVTHMNESCHTYKWVTSHIWMSYVTHMNESCHKYERVMSHM